MSKYTPLWEFIKQNGSASIRLSYDEIASIAVPVDHSFLTYKKELLTYGYRVKKISMKEGMISFVRVEGADGE